MSVRKFGQVNCQARRANDRNERERLWFDIEAKVKDWLYKMKDGRVRVLDIWKCSKCRLLALGFCYIIDSCLWLFAVDKLYLCIVFLFFLLFALLHASG